jgi:hypothetical protein
MFRRRERVGQIIIRILQETRDSKETEVQRRLLTSMRLSRRLRSPMGILLRLRLTDFAIRISLIRI